MGYDFEGDDDSTRERPERLTREVVLEWVVELFAPFASFSVSGKTRPFNCMDPPPQVKVLIVCS